LLFGIAGGLAVRRLCHLIAPGCGFVGLAAFLFFPFAGLDFAFIPRADTLSIAILAAALLMYVQGKWVGFACLVALGLLAQKALWPFLLLAFVLALRQPPARRWFMILVPLPLVVYWLFGLSLGYHPMYLVSGHVAKHLPQAGTFLPIFKGVEASLVAFPAVDKCGKGILVVGVALVATALLIWALRSPVARHRDVVVILAAPILLAAAMLNEYELLRTVRYGQVLAIPFAVFLSCEGKLWGTRARSWAAVAFVVVGVASHLVFFSVSMPRERPTNPVLIDPASGPKPISLRS
jgi:hypothetical protein